MIELTRTGKKLVWYFVQNGKVNWHDFLDTKIDASVIEKYKWIHAGKELYSKGFIRAVAGSTWEYELHPRTIEHWAIINRIRKKHAPKKS